MQLTMTGIPDNIDNATTDTADNPISLSELLIVLFKSILEQKSQPKRWDALLKLQNQVRDFIGVIGLELILDESEGYAFLRTKVTEDDNPTDNSTELPRLISRRQLSFPVSLLLALLRKKLAEFDASGGDTRLILTRSDIVNMLQVFLPQSTNEAKLLDDIDRHINKVIELGFVRRLINEIATEPSYEVKRVLKAFVDAKWLGDFAQKLQEYKDHLITNGE